MTAEPAAAPSPAGQLGQFALAAVNGTMSTRLRKVLTTYAIVGMTVQVGKSWWDKLESRVTHTVTITGRDELYPDVHAWLLERIPARKRRSLVARSKRRSGELVAIPDGGVERRGDDGELSLLYDGGRQRVEIDGHRVAVHIDKPAFSLDWLKDDNWSRMSDVEQMVFTATSIAGRDAVLAFLRRVSEHHYREDRDPTVFMAMRYGDWRRRRDSPRRSLDTVVLRGDQREDLVGDLDDFLHREQDYARLGMPWHRGYLFEGPPGTGKTSIARALSTHFGLDIYYVPLSDLDTDNALMQLVGNIEPRSILLLEDIDAVHAATERSDERDGVTISGLLNVVDGLMSAHGVVVIMTTNNPDKLDGALLRAGRIDKRVHVGYLDEDQLNRLVVTFLGRTGFTLPPLTQSDLAAVDVVGVFKRHLDDPQAALVELKEMLGDGPCPTCGATDSVPLTFGLRCTNAWHEGGRGEGRAR